MLWAARRYHSVLVDIFFSKCQSELDCMPSSIPPEAMGRVRWRLHNSIQSSQNLRVTETQRRKAAHSKPAVPVPGSQSLQRKPFPSCGFCSVSCRAYQRSAPLPHLSAARPPLTFSRSIQPERIFSVRWRHNRVINYENLDLVDVEPSYHLFSREIMK